MAKFLVELGSAKVNIIVIRYRLSICYFQSFLFFPVKHLCSRETGFGKATRGEGKGSPCLFRETDSLWVYHAVWRGSAFFLFHGSVDKDPGI